MTLYLSELDIVCWEKSNLPGEALGIEAKIFFQACLKKIVAKSPGPLPRATPQF